MASTFPSFPVCAGINSAIPNPCRACARKKRGLLARFLDALIASRQREAEERVARLLVQSGGKFTDSLEREAERSVLGR